MSGNRQIDIDIRPWSDGDLPLLERLLGDPAMMEHLGGPETLEKIRERHGRYCRIGTTGSDLQFTIVIEPERTAAGWIGYRESEWRGQTVLETGWSVLPEFQGRGIATMAARLMVERLRAEGKKTRFVHVCTSIDNGPSNAICRKAGFALLGEADSEYPKGHFMRCNEWCLDLFR